MEDVGGRGVVDDDDLVEVPAQTTQVLYIVPTVEHTGLAEEPATERTPLIKEIGHGVCILRNTHFGMHHYASNIKCLET